MVTTGFLKDPDWYSIQVLTKQGQTVNKQRRCTEIQSIRHQRNSEYKKIHKNIIKIFFASLHFS